MKPNDQFKYNPVIKETTKPSRKMRKRKFKRSSLTTMGVKVVATVAFILGLLVGYQAAPTATATSTTASQPPQPAVGLVAYHTNNYQLHAINLLMQRDQVEQWSCLWALWTAESNWRNKAENKSSGAYGIAQFMPATWKNVGYEKTSDGYIQVEAGLAYLDHRYAGSPCKAYAHFLAKRWY
jgi:hypothetical protein